MKKINKTTFTNKQGKTTTHKTVSTENKTILLNSRNEMHFQTQLKTRATVEKNKKKLHPRQMKYKDKY